MKLVKLIANLGYGSRKDVAVRDRIVGVQHLAGGVGDAAFAEQLRDLLAAAIAEVGDEPDEFHVLARFIATARVSSLRSH